MDIPVDTKTRQAEQVVQLQVASLHVVMADGTSFDVDRDVYPYQATLTHRLIFTASQPWDKLTWDSRMSGSELEFHMKFVKGFYKRKLTARDRWKMWWDKHGITVGSNDRLTILDRYVLIGFLMLSAEYIRGKYEYVPIGIVVLGMISFGILFILNAYRIYSKRGTNAPPAG